MQKEEEENGAGRDSGLGADRACLLRRCTRSFGTVPSAPSVPRAPFLDCSKGITNMCDFCLEWL